MLAARYAGHFPCTAKNPSKRSARWGCQLRAGIGSPRAWAVTTSVR